MNLKDILSISGRTGLYKLNTQTRAGVVATSITDGKTIISSAAERISMLSEVNIYCIGKEISLTEVFEKMLVFESGAITKIKHNASSSDLKAYFFDVLEEYDEERVYPSDIKKIIQWYNILVTKQIIVSQEDKHKTKSPEKNLFKNKK